MEEDRLEEAEWLTLAQLFSCQNSSYTWQVTARDRLNQIPLCRRFETEAVAVVFAQALAPTHDMVALEHTPLGSSHEEVNR